MTLRQMGARLRKASARNMQVGFLHTLDGRPAYFDGEQVVFSHQLPHWEDEYDATRVVASLEELLDQQAASLRYRSRKGWDVPHMGYVVVGFPRV